MFGKSPDVPSTSSAPAIVLPGSGAAGAFRMLIIGVGNGAAFRSPGSVRCGGFVWTVAIGVGSSGFGDSSQRQKRVSSFFSQALQAPMIASPKTPRVGTLTRYGGTGVNGW